MYLTVKGLVLRVCPYNDTDAMVTILTAQQGKISAKARGLRRKNSPLIAPCQLLSYGEFTLFARKDLFVINEAHSLELFTPLRSDLLKLSLGSYFAQVSEVISQEDMPNPQLLSLVLNCLYGLCRMELDRSKCKAVFELRAACLAGYTPDLYGCSVCGSENGDCIDLSEGRLVCADCARHGGNGIRMPLTAGILEAMRYLCLCDPKQIFAFTLPPERMEQLSEITQAYLSTQLERGFSTLDFYKSLFYQNPSST